MRILMITLEPPLQPRQIASGNSVRAAQLTTALENGGHQVEQAWLSKESGISGRSDRRKSFRNHDELNGLLQQSKPDIVLVGYWELLGLLPHDLGIPVILDYVAPRALEELFESPESVQFNLRRLRVNLGRCDLVIVGNEKQTHLLTYNLIEAGFDLRGEIPVIIVPPGAEPTETKPCEPGDGDWQLVAGGVNWPWRENSPHAQMLEQIAADQTLPVRITHFGGSHAGNPESVSDSYDASRRKNTAGIDHRKLIPYDEFSTYLSNKVHIGVELESWNIERAYSQSFRSLEFLRHGLPLLCNDYLPIAKLIREYDAGWLISEPAELPGLIEQIVQDEAAWRAKSVNARNLVQTSFAPEKSAASLLDWLSGPMPTERIRHRPLKEESEPVLGVPPLAVRLNNQLRLARRVIFGKLFGKPKNSGIIIVTRGDIFPANHGAAVRTMATAYALADNGIDVAIVTDDRRHWFRVSPQNISKEKYPFWTKLLVMPNFLVKLLHYSKDIPFNNSFLYLPLTDGSFFWRTVAVLAKTGAGTLQAEFPAYARPCHRIREIMDCKVVLVEHNVEYERIRSQVTELEDRQFDNLKSIEINLCNASDAVVCVSENDRQKLAEDGVNPERLHTISHGVDLKQYDKEATTDVREQFDIGIADPILVYHGIFSYPPNQQALKTFAEILLPGLEARGITAHVLAVGRHPPPLSPHERIHLTGVVDEVAPWLKACDIAVIPLSDGGGTRMKIIDCFAARLPVIATSKGIEGIPVIEGQHALVIDEWEAFIDGIAQLWQNPELADKLAANGRVLADSLDWNNAAKKYAAIYSSI